MINEGLAQNPPPPQMPIKVSQDGSVVCLTFGRADSAEDRKKGGGLAAAPNYVKAMGQVKQANPAMAVYVDVAAGVAMVNDAFAKMPAPPEVKAKVPVVIDALGLNSFTQMALLSGFDGTGWSDHAFLGVNGPKKGILALMDEGPIGDTVLGWIPKEAAALSAAKMDLHKIFSEMRTVIGKIDDNALKEFDQGLAQANQQIHMDVEQDIVAPFGDEWAVYRAPLSDAGGMSFAMVTKLRDGDRLAKTLTQAEGMINEAAQGRFKIDKMTTSKIEVSSISFLQYSVAWTVRNGYLYISSLDGIAGAVKQVENKLPSIVESDLYKGAIAAAMPPGVKPVAISYSNPAKLYPELRRTLLGLMPLARAAGLDLPSDLLPDTDDISKFLTPGARVSWWDADGLHGVGRSAFPGSEIVGGSPGGPTMVGVAAVGAAVLMPSLGRAREMANRSLDAANERGLAQSCLVWAASNNDNMPDDLARLVAEGDISPKQLVSKRAGTTPLQWGPEMEQLSKSDFAKFSQMVAQHCDYVYLGKGTKGNADASIVVTYEKPGPQTRDGMSISFGDAHAEFVRLDSLEQIFSATNDQRKKLGLPEVNVREIMMKSTGGGAATAVPGRGRP
jgi:hypothetical protein